MKKLYRKLTKDQKKRGVIFSSALSGYTSECFLDTIHEVFNNNEKGQKTIERLKDDSFFNNSPIFKYNIIRA